LQHVTLGCSSPCKAWLFNLLDLLAFACKGAQLTRSRFFNILKTYLQFLKLAWRAYPAGISASLLIEILAGFIPLATAWLAKLLFDMLALSLHPGGNTQFPRGIVPLLLAQASLLIVRQLSASANAYLNAELARRTALSVQTTIYRKINSLTTIEYFEQSHFHSTIQLAVQGARNGPTQAVQLCVSLLRNTITLATFIGILLSLSPALTGLVAVASLPQLFAQTLWGHQRFTLAVESSPKERRASYFGHLLSTTEFSKEIRLFNLGEHFLQAFLRTSREIHEVQRSQQKREIRWQIALDLLNSLVGTGAFIAVVFQAFAGGLSIGDVTLYVGAVASVQSALSSIVSAMGQVNENVLFYKRYTELLSLSTSSSPAHQEQLVPMLTQGIEFRHISFRYSDRHPWIFHDLNLHIPAGQCLALVGLNGAGKTTLVKLLTRLYEPTQGQILWDGIDIQEFEPQELRHRCGVLLQDFVRYGLTAHENIGIGDVERIERQDLVQRAAVTSGADEMISKLPHGYQTSLNRWLDDNGIGVDLSGGEWQKIAMARMFMREADLQILDEPTAALDAQAEYDFYSRALKLIADRTCIIISHRMSTVRMADIIAVLEGGKISEYGTHAKLMATNGRYATLYRLQAQQYREVPHQKAATAGQP